MLVKMEHFKNYHRSEKVASDVLMMFGRMVFGPIVGIVEFARAPIDAKLLVAFVVAEPVKMSVHGLGLFKLDFAIDNSISHSVVV